MRSAAGWRTCGRRWGGERGLVIGARGGNTRGPASGTHWARKSSFVYPKWIALRRRVLHTHTHALSCATCEIACNPGVHHQNRITARHCARTAHGSRRAMRAASCNNTACHCGWLHELGPCSGRTFLGRISPTTIGMGALGERSTTGNWPKPAFSARQAWRSSVHQSARHGWPNMARCCFRRPKSKRARPTKAKNAQTIRSNALAGPLADDGTSSSAVAPSMICRPPS
jgi:hypothetical protein